jgi:hypothetical protein
MLCSPRRLTLGAMHTDSYQQVVLGSSPEPRRIFCTTCEHSEFIHGDYEARRCLYSTCGCSGLTVGAAALTPA